MKESSVNEIQSERTAKLKKILKMLRIALHCKQNLSRVKSGILVMKRNMNKKVLGNHYLLSAISGFLHANRLVFRDNGLFYFSHHL